jgi:hypothetical protein
MASLSRRCRADGARNFKGRILIELNLFHRPSAVKKFHTPTSHFHESLHRTNSLQCRLADIDRSKHIKITGMSRMGKSPLLVNLFIEHICRGYGGSFIDPHETRLIRSPSSFQKAGWETLSGLTLMLRSSHRSICSTSIRRKIKSLASSAWGGE